MAVDDLMSDDIFIETAGQMRGPFKASVQGNKVYIGDETVVIDEGDRIFRVLPNGKSESHLVLLRKILIMLKRLLLIIKLKRRTLVFLEIP